MRPSLTSEEDSTGTAAPPATIPGTINAQGGVPIKVGDMTIGAVAVSGAPGRDLVETRMRCARAPGSQRPPRLK
jgi:uncharacterized protein GlcG (DUF336 family)